MLKQFKSWNSTMNNGYYYQLLAFISSPASGINLPRHLKDIAREGDITHVSQLTEFFGNEMVQSGVQNEEDLKYFTFIADMSLNFCMYRGDYEQFFQLMAVLEQKLEELNPGNFDDSLLESWKKYFEYIKLCARRLMRHANLEEFENYIDNFDWSSLAKNFIPKISGLTGFTYLNETDRDRFVKSRFWLQKAFTESDEVSGLVHLLNLARYFINEGDQASAKHLDDLLEKLKSREQSNQESAYKNLLHSAILELKARISIFRNDVYDDGQVKIAEKLSALKELEAEVIYEIKTTPLFTKAYVKLEFGLYYKELSKLASTKKEIGSIFTIATENINEALRLADRIYDPILQRHAQLHWIACQRNMGEKVQEKDIRELVASFRKSENYPLYAAASNEHARYFEFQDNPRKAYDVYFELLKTGAKLMEEGGFYLVIKAMEQIHSIFLNEAESPGQSFMIAELDPYFEKIIEITDSLEENLNLIGTDLFAKFRLEYARMEPASHYNAKVYLKYQWYEVKILRLSAIATGDKVAQKMSENLIRELSHKNNPLSFIQADWEDFKDVPNSVRNKMLNLCISISKGDLPLAAEHLDFSYRNLRSYITFKEVNRLGFFLDEQRTRNRQLEQGVRLMFHDLYKNGTIFEVVFDMPKFLVETVDVGFSSQDMEESLKIKGTTAKKYIKIMLDIDLIEMEKSVGRKHFYKLRKDNVMTRFGKEQKVLTT